MLSQYFVKVFSISCNVDTDFLSFLATLLISQLEYELVVCGLLLIIHQYTYLACTINGIVISHLIYILAKSIS